MSPMVPRVWREMRTKYVVNGPQAEPVGERGAVGIDAPAVGYVPHRQKTPAAVVDEDNLAPLSLVDGN